MTYFFKYNCVETVKRTKKTLAIIIVFSIVIGMFGTTIGEVHDKKNINSNDKKNSVQTDPNLVACWDFNEGSGTVAHDSSGNNNNATLNGATWINGINGNALYFDGVNDYAQAPDSQSLDISGRQITVEAWIKPHELANLGKPIIDKRQSGYHDGWALWKGENPVPTLASFSVHGPLATTPDTVHGTTSLRNDVFYNVVGTYDGAYIKIYVNGHFENSLGATHDIPLNNGPLLIGHDIPNNYYYSGIIDEVRIYNRTLTASEIMDHYNLIKNHWVRKTPMPTARVGAGSAAVNGKIYVIGGQGSGGLLNIVEAYDPGSDTWQTGLAPMPTPRTGLSAVAVNGKIYALGGSDGASQYYNKNEVYDPAGNSWSTANHMPTPRLNFGAAESNGIIYAIGGNNGSYLKTVEAYNPVNDTWWSRAPMPTKRSGLGAIAVNGVIYAVGGGAPSYLSTVEAYNISANTWQSQTPMPFARGGNTASINGIVYEMGGWNVGTVRRCDAYNPKNNTWWSVEDMITPRAGAISVVNGKLYDIGGTDGTNPLSANEEYTPLDYPNSNTPPVCAIASPIPSQKVNKTVVIQGTASDPDGNSGLVATEVRFDSGNWLAGVGTASWHYDWDTTKATDGSHTIYARSLDNESEYSSLVSVDVIVNNTTPNQRPSCSLVSPAGGVNVSGLVTVSGTASDPDGSSGLVGVEVKIDAGGAWLPATGAVSWVFVWDTTTETNGYHTIYARSLDNGSEYSDLASVIVQVNNTQSNRRPVCSFVSPLGGDIVSGAVNITGTASDPDGNSSLVIVEISIDNGTWMAATGTVSWKFSWDPTALANGNHMLYARAADNESAVSYVASEMVTVVNIIGNTPPACAIASPGMGVIVAGTISVTGTAHDPDGDIGLASVQVKVDSSGSWAGAAGQTAWSFQWDTGTVANGAHTIYARALDNKSTASTVQSVIVNVQNTDLINHNPVCIITYPSNGSSVNGSIAIQGSATDIDGISTIQNVEIKIDTGNWNLAVGTGSWSYSWDTTYVLAGVHDIFARAFDGINYSAQSTCWVGVNNTQTTHHGWIAGFVKSNLNSQPLAGAIFAVDGRSETCTTDISGRYNISLPAGSYNITVQSPGYDIYAAENISVTSSKTTLMDCTLIASSGDIAGRVVDAGTGSGIDNATVRVSGWAVSAHTDGTGNYLLSNVKTGACSLSVTADGYVDSSKNITVVKDNTIYQNFSITGWCIIYGVVKDEDSGLAVGGVLIIIDVGYTESLENGTYSIEAPAAGYNITAVKQGYLNFTSHIAAHKGFNLLDITIKPINNHDTGSFNWFLPVLIICLIIVPLVLIAVMAQWYRRMRAGDSARRVQSEGPAQGQKVTIPPVPLGKKKAAATGQLDIIEQSILDLIKEHPGSDPRWIARVLELRIDNLHEHIRGLTNAGYITVVQSPDNEDVSYYIKGKEPKQDGQQ